MSKIEAFTNEVIDELNYYVYRLIDPRNGETFYVGKGKGNRVFAHEKDALKDYCGKNYIDKDNDEDDASLKIQQIREIHNSGLDVISIIHRYGMDENTAFEVEAALIDCYSGLTNLQAGHASDRGINNVETIQKNLSLEAFDDNNDLKYCVIKINDESLKINGSIYETVRKHWKVDINRARKLDYALASYKGVVRGVYKIDEWFDSDVVPGRKMFVGKEAETNIKEKFLNKRLPNEYIKKGSANPVLYHDEKSKKAVKAKTKGN